MLEDLEVLQFCSVCAKKNIIRNMKLYQMKVFLFVLCNAVILNNI